MPRKPAQPADTTTPHGRLRWARERAGYSSPREAAKELGWNENTYKSHENGLRQKDGLKLATLRKYARAFGVKAEWLMLGIGNYQLSPTDAEWADLTPAERELALRLLDATRQATSA